MLRATKVEGAKDEARLIETSAKRSYVPMVYYGSRRLLPNAHVAKVIPTYVQYLRLDACRRVLVRLQHALYEHACASVRYFKFQFYTELHSFKYIINGTEYYTYLIENTYFSFAQLQTKEQTTFKQRF